MIVDYAFKDVSYWLLDNFCINLQADALYHNENQCYIYMYHLWSSGPHVW